MKKIFFAVSGLVILFTACKKESLIPPQSADLKMNSVKISGNDASVKLISVEEVTNMDYCFKLFFDHNFQEDFRFTGSYNLWSYKDLSKGTHALDFACLHTCDDAENENKILQFEIDDGDKKQLVIASKTDHCLYQINIVVNSE